MSYNGGRQGDDPMTMDREIGDPGDSPLPGGEEPSRLSGMDAVIEVYKRDVDRSLLRANLALTVEERLEKFQDFMEFLDEVRSSGRGPRGSVPAPGGA
jgi:hypothetical protein